ELLELVDVHVRKQIGARGEKLPELDVRRAELLERLAELAGALARRGAATPDAELAQHAQQPRLPGDAPDVQRALPTLSPDAHQGDISRCSGLETRRLHALPRKEAVHR